MRRRSTTIKYCYVLMLLLHHKVLQLCTVFLVYYKFIYYHFFFFFFRPLTEKELQQRHVEARKRHAEILAQRENSVASGKAGSSEGARPGGHAYLESKGVTLLGLVLG